MILSPPSLATLAWRFLVLGATCFGGPSVHLAVFQQMFVGKWFTAPLFAELMAFAHVLPGPTSTQVAFLIGLVVLDQDNSSSTTAEGVTKPAVAGGTTVENNTSMLRAALLPTSTTASPGTKGNRVYPWYLSGLVSGCLFILPGFVLMSLLGYLTVEYQSLLSTSTTVGCVLIGLASVGWGMVGSSAKGMIQGTCGTTTWKLLVCGGSCVLTLLFYPTSWIDYLFPVLILAGGLVALAVGERQSVGDDAPPPSQQPQPLSASAVLLQNSLAVLLLLLWLLLLLLCIFLPAFSASVFAEFYTTGALVFGGGPVVLPLLDKKLVSTNRITPQEFLAGLSSLGQAIPGPMFNLGTYLGALCLPGGNVWAGAVFGCVGLFSPGVLLIFGFYPFWKVLREKSDAYQRMLPGMNASATGLIAASLFVLYRQLVDQEKRMRFGQLVDQESGPAPPDEKDLGEFLVPAVAIMGVSLVKIANWSEPLAILAGGAFTGLYHTALAAK